MLTFKQNIIRTERITIRTYKHKKKINTHTHTSNGFESISLAIPRISMIRYNIYDLYLCLRLIITQEVIKIGHI